MSTHPPSPGGDGDRVDRAIEDIIDAETHSRAFGLAAWYIPVLASTLVAWLVVPVLNRLPASLGLKVLYTAVAIAGSYAATQALVQWSGRGLIRRKPVVRDAPDAIAAVQDAIAEGTGEGEILDTARRQIERLLHPSSLHITLYDTAGQGYVTRDGPEALPSAHPFVAWILHQAVADPVPTSDIAPEILQGVPHADTTDVVVPLGRPGWMSLGGPDDRRSYSPGDLCFLHLLCRPAALAIQHINLVKAEASRAEELQVLYWIAQAVNFAMDVDTLMELIYTQLKRVMRVPTFGVALVDPHDGALGFSFYVEDGERNQPSQRWSTEEGLSSIVLKTNSTIRTDDYVEECRRREVEPVFPGKPGAWLGTALTSEDDAFGMLVACSRSPTLAFTQAEENLFVTVAAYTAAILERHALYEQLESRARELATLNNIGNLLASSLDLDEVLDLVVRNAADLLDTEAGSLLLLDQASGDLVFRISSGPSGKDLVGLRIPAGKGIAGAAFSESRPVISQDTHQDKRWYSGFDERSSFVTNSVLAVPLNARGRTIGVLEVVNRKGGRGFTQEDADFLASYGAPAAIAIENAQLFTNTDQALQARVEELTTLQYIDRQLNATLSYEAVMQQTLEWAVHITGATIGVVAALQEDDTGARGLRFLAHHGYRDADLAPYTEDELWPLDRGLIGHTVREGSTTLVTDVTEDDHYLELQPDMTAQLTVPIKREMRVIGAIALESVDATAFDTDRVAFVERLVDHAAIAIENARLFEQVERANQAKTEFISFVSHELRQPMTSMQGYTDLLVKGIGGPLSPQQTRFVDVVRSNIARMNRLVEDLLDISRIEAGRLKLEIEPVQPDKVVAEAVQAFRHEITAKQQDLVVEVGQGLPSVSGDKGRLVQVLTNLISNANKYTPEGGRITVSAQLEANNGASCVRWKVQDTGIGMTADELEQLFTKFFRSTRSVVQSVQGTGLGLVITRSIVEMHGGTLSVESQAGTGSEFSFTVPLAA